MEILIISSIKRDTSSKIRVTIFSLKLILLSKNLNLSLIRKTRFWKIQFHQRRCDQMCWCIMIQN